MKRAEPAALEQAGDRFSGGCEVAAPQLGVDVHLGDAGVDGSADLRVGNAGRAMQRKRCGDDMADCFEALPVERRWVAVHAMDVPDRNGETIGAPSDNEISSQVGIGERAGRNGLSHIFVAAELSEFCFDGRAGVAGQVNGSPDELDIFLVRHRGAIGHDGPGAVAERRLDYVEIVAVVELHTSPCVRPFGDREKGGEERTTVAPGKRLATDQDDDTNVRSLGRMQCCDHRLQVVGSERAHCSAVRAIGEQLGKPDQHRWTAVRRGIAGAIASTTSARSAGPPTFPGTTT